MTSQEIRKDIIENAMAYNRNIEFADLENKSDMYILAFCHPLERQDFINKLDKAREKEKKDADKG